MILDAWRKGIRNFDAEKAFEIIDHTEETESLVPWYRGPLTELDRFYKANGYYPGLPTNQQEWVEGVDRRWEHRQCVSLTLVVAAPRVVDLPVEPAVAPCVLLSVVRPGGAEP